MHAIDARGVELGLGHVDRSGDAMPESGRDGLAAHVAWKRGHEYFVSPLEGRQDRPPGFGAESERVQEKERLSRAAVMSDGRPQDHSQRIRVKDIIPTIELRGSRDQRGVSCRGSAPIRACRPLRYGPCLVCLSPVSPDLRGRPRSGAACCRRLVERQAARMHPRARRLVGECLGTSQVARAQALLRPHRKCSVEARRERRDGAGGSRGRARSQRGAARTCGAARARRTGACLARPTRRGTRSPA